MIHVYKFNESQLISELLLLSSEQRIAFATAAAARQLANYERYAEKIHIDNSHRAREITSQIWEELRQERIDLKNWQEKLDTIMDMLPGEDDCGQIAPALAEHALSTLAYAIRCLMNHDAKEAAWAARRAYEASDGMAIFLLGIQSVTRNVELMIESHDVVQRELARQRRDIEILSFGSIETLQLQAMESDMLSAADVMALKTLPRD